MVASDRSVLNWPLVNHRAGAKKLYIVWSRVWSINLGNKPLEWHPKQTTINLQNQFTLNLFGAGLLANLISPLCAEAFGQLPGLLSIQIRKRLGCFGLIAKFGGTSNWCLSCLRVGEKLVSIWSWINEFGLGRMISLLVLVHINKAWNAIFIHRPFKKRILFKRIGFRLTGC